MASRRSGADKVLPQLITLPLGGGVVLSPGMAIHLRGKDMSFPFNQVTVLGAGVLGAQISFQIAYRGFEVTTYGVSDAALTQARQRFEGIAASTPKR
jgi:hypothetical protein